MAKAHATAARLRELFEYSPDSGELRWRTSRRAGEVAGCLDTSLGYRRISVDGRLHYAHRIAWAMVNGDHAEHPIDHIDGDRANNRWANLRLAAGNINQTNKRPFAGGWKVQVRKKIDGRVRSFGYVSTQSEAAAATLLLDARAFIGQAEPDVIGETGLSGWLEGSRAI